RCLCRREKDRERRYPHPPWRELSRPRVQREHGSRAVPAHQPLRLRGIADDAPRGAGATERDRVGNGTGIRSIPHARAGKPAPEPKRGRPLKRLMRPIATAPVLAVIALPAVAQESTP